MPVLAEIQLILDLLNSIEPPPPPKDEAELLDRVRAQIGMVQEPVNESLAVASVENVILEWDGLKISARVYKPLNQPVALMVYLHGGGFCAGNLDTHDGLMRRYCGNGSIVVVNVDYRLAPENPFPANIAHPSRDRQVDSTANPLLARRPPAPTVALSGSSACGVCTYFLQM